jgi:hypothetical protein
MKVDIEISEASYGKFSQIKLGYVNSFGLNQKVELSVDFLSMYDFAKDTSSTRFDFFLISSIVYGIDNLLNRELFSIDGWAREIEVVFPVKNLSSWQGNETHLANTLKFLTGDFWFISFEQLNTKKLFIEKDKRWTRKIPIYQKHNIRSINLFSGGLDSLIGAINTLGNLQNGDKVIFASHFDSNSVGPNSDQRALINILSNHFAKKLYWLQTTVTLSRNDTNNNSLVLEDSYRSRSLLFIGIGVYFFSNVKTDTLIIPENGTISLNFPLTPSRASSLSTRTTHPYFLSLVQALISKTIGNIHLSNPYSLQTKGEMVLNCMDQKALEASYTESVSCGKRGRKSYWAIRSGTDHCGVCMPCIYRRAALHRKGLDIQTYGNDILNANSVNQYVDMPALFDYLKTSLPLEKIKRDLVVNGSLPFDKLEDFAQVIVRSRAELLKWFSDKGNTFIKNELGLK